MIFNSFQFLWLLPLIFVIYYSFFLFRKKSNNKNRIANIALLLISYLVYFKYNPLYTLILLWVTLTTFYGALLLERKSVCCKKKHLIATLAVLSLLPLLIFKYYNFATESVKQILSVYNIEIGLPGLNWAVPLGISFFTFQALGYLFDVYYKRTEIENNILDYMLFVSFFPQIASGPISKASDLLPQIKSNRSFSYEKTVEGLKLLLWGLFMKTVVADRLGLYVDTVYSYYQYYSGITCFVASILYTIEIYTDFAGYSLMAVGVGKIFGFDLINNFNRPYLAPTITEFWKRWHISLTKWLTSYVYIPLGGNRCSKFRNYLNIMSTFLVSGLWHGANWTFVVWGAIHGVLQILEKAFGIQKMEETKKGPIRILRILFTFLLVNFAWIFFRMPSISDAYCFIGRIFTQTGSLFLDTKTNTVLIVFAFLVIFTKEIIEEINPNFSLFSNKSTLIRWTSYTIVTLLILLIGVLDSGQFIYVSF